MPQNTTSSAPSADPTLLQLAGALTVGKIWAVILAATTALAATATAGYFLGNRVGELSAQEKLNAASTSLAKAEAGAVVREENAKQAAEKVKQYSDYAASLNAQISDRDKQIAALSERLGRTNTCGFLQQQISSLEQQIANISSGKRIRTGIFVFSGDTAEQRKRDEERKAQDDAEVAQLQQRVIAFTQQLNACAR